jgi:hypothetical protein
MTRALSLFLLCVATVAMAQSNDATASPADYPKPERQVVGHTISSTHDPAVRITFASPFKYVGAVRWPLYNVADAELHIFVDAGPDKRVRRFYWVQFEGYLPSKPEAKHDYSGSEAHTEIAGWSWFVDARVVEYPQRNSRADSDGAHARRLITDAGYIFPEAMAHVRLVYLTDASTRKELMIIYEEDMARLGANLQDVEGNAAPGHARFRDQMIDHAKAGMKIEPQ